MLRRCEEEYWRSVSGQSSYTAGPADCIPAVLICVFLQVISSLVFNGFSEDVSWNVNSTAELQKASTLRWPVGTCWADLAPAAAKMCPKPRAPLAQHKRSTQVWVFAWLCDPFPEQCRFNGDPSHSQEKTSGFAKLDPGFDAAIRMCSHRTNTAKQKEGSLYGNWTASAAGQTSAQPALTAAGCGAAPGPSRCGSGWQGGVKQQWELSPPPFASPEMCSLACHHLPLLLVRLPVVCG